MLLMRIKEAMNIKMTMKKMSSTITFLFSVIFENKRRLK